MYLYQKFNYKTTEIKNDKDLEDLVNNFDPSTVFAVFDTETTGLNIMVDTPFLLVFGWGKSLFLVDLVEDKDLGERTIHTMFTLFSQVHRVFAHNATYDGHMLINYGTPMPEYIDYSDSQTVVRLTTPSDLMYNKSLADVGQRYVDNNAKFASKVIKGRMNEINAERKAVIKEHYNTYYRDGRRTGVIDVPFGRMWDMYNKERIPFVEHEYEYVFRVFDEYYTPANYYDVYVRYPDLMKSYAYDDIVIMLEYLPKALIRLQQTDPDFKVFYKESDLIGPTIDLDRVGFQLNIDYVLASRIKVVAYQKELYNRLWDMTGIPGLSVNQHAVLRKLFSSKYGLLLTKVNNDALSSIEVGENGQHKDAFEVSSTIQELRTIDKWLSTYIDGMLHRCTNGRVHTSVDNSGTVSGRVTSNMQQMPNGALKNRAGEELYNPRKAFSVDEEYYMVIFDYSQQELRVQAYLTILVSGGDLNLCRAYMPYKCVSAFTEELFDYTNPEHIKRWDSSEWLLEEELYTVWEPTDVHSATTFEAFPFLNGSTDHPDFKSLRGLGKVANFLKNYGGGFNAIKTQLKVSDDIARNLDSAYYRAFPDIKVYQRWIEVQLTKYGFVENLYGRRYYMSDPRYFYKAGNYMVQGASADMIKSAILRVAPLLKGRKSKLLMTIHDELDFLIHKSEADELIPIIRQIMLDVPEVPYVPMAVDVEYSETSWGEISEWEGDLGE